MNLGARRGERVRAFVRPSQAEHAMAGSDQVLDDELSRRRALGNGDRRLARELRRRPARISSNARRDLPEPEGPRMRTALVPTRTAEA